MKASSLLSCLSLLATPLLSSPLPLQEAIQKAICHSLALEEARQKVDGLRLVSYQSLSPPPPRFVVEMENGWRHHKEHRGLQAGEIRYAIEQELPLGRELLWRRKIALLLVDLAEIDLRTNERSLQLEVTERYIEALFSAKRERLARETWFLEQQLFEALSAMSENGKIPPFRLREEARILAEAESRYSLEILERQAATFELLSLIGEINDEPILEELSPPLWPEGALCSLGENLAYEKSLLELALAKAEEKLLIALSYDSMVGMVGVKQQLDENNYSLLLGIDLPLPLWNSQKGEKIRAARECAQRAIACETIAQSESRTLMVHEQKLSLKRKRIASLAQRKDSLEKEISLYASGTRGDEERILSLFAKRKELLSLEEEILEEERVALLLSFTIVYMRGVPS